MTLVCCCFGLVLWMVWLSCGFVGFVLVVCGFDGGDAVLVMIGLGVLRLPAFAVGGC